MDNWQAWVTALFGFLLTILGVNYRMDKKRNEDSIKEFSKKDAELAERIARLESELMTEREVRQVLKDYFGPFMEALTKMQHDVTDIKVQIARLPKREEDR